MGKRVALLVGINDYGKSSGLAKLNYAEADAKLLAGTLEKVGDFSTQTVLGNNAVIKNITQEIEKLRPDPDIDLFLIYFAGHGEEVDSKHYLHCFNSQKGFTFNCLKTQELTELIKKRVNAEHIILIFDACREHIGRDSRGTDNEGLSRSLHKDLHAISTKSIEVSPWAVGNMPKPRLIFTLLSCSVGQVSYEDDNLGQGIFTYALSKEIEKNGRQLPLDQLVKRVGDFTIMHCMKNEFHSEQFPQWISPQTSLEVFLADKKKPIPKFKPAPKPMEPLTTSNGKETNKRGTNASQLSNGLFSISPKHLDEMSFVFENLSSDLSSLLSFYLTFQVDVSFDSIEELTYSELVDRFPSPTYINVISMEPFSEPSLLEISPSILFPMLDILNGGNDHSSDASLPLENLDKGLTGGLVKTILEGFQEGWTALNSLKMSVIQTETLPRDLAVLSKSQNVLSISFELAMGMPKGLMHFCLPHTLVMEITG